MPATRTQKKLSIVVASLLMGSPRKAAETTSRGKQQQVVPTHFPGVTLKTITRGGIGEGKGQGCSFLFFYPRTRTHTKHTQTASALAYHRKESSQAEPSFNAWPHFYHNPPPFSPPRPPPFRTVCQTKKATTKVRYPTGCPPPPPPLPSTPAAPSFFTPVFLIFLQTT